MMSSSALLKTVFLAVVTSSNLLDVVAITLLPPVAADTPADASVVAHEHIPPPTCLDELQKQNNATLLAVTDLLAPTPSGGLTCPAPEDFVKAVRERSEELPALLTDLLASSGEPTFLNTSQVGFCIDIPTEAEEGPVHAAARTSQEGDSESLVSAPLQEATETVARGAVAGPPKVLSLEPSDCCRWGAQEAIVLTLTLVASCAVNAIEFFGDARRPRPAPRRVRPVAVGRARGAVSVAALLSTLLL